MKNKILATLVAVFVVLAGSIAYGLIGSGGPFTHTQQLDVYTVSTLKITKLNDLVYNANFIPTTGSTPLWKVLGSSIYKIEGTQGEILSVSGIKVWANPDGYGNCTPIPLTNGTLTTSIGADAPFVACLHMTTTSFASNVPISGGDVTSIALPSVTANVYSVAYIYVELVMRQSTLPYVMLGVPLTGNIQITITYNS